MDAGTSEGVPDADALGQPRVDLDSIPNTGRGSRNFVDMGAFETQKFVPPTGGAAGADVTKPVVRLQASSPQRLRAKAVRFVATCSEACRVFARATIGRHKKARSGKNARDRRARARRLVTIRRTTRFFEPQLKVKLRIGKRQMRKARRAIRGRKKLYANITVVAVDRSGNRSRVTKRVVLKGAKPRKRR